MALLDQQIKFSLMIAKLIQFAYEQGYGITMGEVYRPPETAALNAKKGIGVADSFHTKKLAADLLLFKGKTYLKDTPSYKPLGDYWKSIGGTWGGDFKKKDGNHFSLGE